MSEFEADFGFVTARQLEQLFDVMLYGHVHRTGVPARIARQLVQTMDAIEAAESGPDLRLLRRVVEHLGFEGEGSDHLISSDCANASRLAVARVVAAGLRIDGTGLDAVDAARDCSFFLDRCYYVSAARELTILVGLIDREDSADFGPEIRRFVGQAWEYLGAMSRFMDSPGLAWECDLYRCAIIGRG